MRRLAAILITLALISTAAADGLVFLGNSAPATSGSTLLLGNGAGGFSAYTGVPGVAHQWINSLSAAGAAGKSQPACADLSDSVASCSTDATNASNISSGTLPAARLPLTSATTQGSPSNPTGTVSTTGVMMGLGTVCKITPVYSGRVNVTFYGSVSSSSAGAFSATVAKFGTGTAPANGAAFSGTTIGTGIFNISGTAGQVLSVSTGGIVTGLTPGTAYWFDIDAASSSGASTVAYQNIGCAIMEF